MNIYQKFVELVEGNMLRCPSKLVTGADCPGCGIQRAIVLLLKGNIVESFYMYPPLFPLIFTVFFLIVRVKNKSDWSLIALKYSYFATAIFLVVNFLIKII
ncbi:MAG: DUF2752 domain-containing protein [Saprospiraceae bacterium]|nr:DUF2752 domain-containing protein [Saprospiraceae bacterium]